MEEDGPEAAATVDGSRGQLGELTALTRVFQRAVTSAFKNGTTHVKGFESALRSAALQMSSMVLKSALKPLTAGLGNATNSLFGNLFGGNAAPAAEADVTGFAQGGVFASPRYFPMQNGLGVLGEAGPEAVMPLTRGADGRLGVAAASGRDGKVIVNIATPDAPSFLRSETQVSAALARAVARGRRGL